MNWQDDVTMRNITHFHFDIARGQPLFIGLRMSRSLKIGSAAGIVAIFMATLALAVFANTEKTFFQFSTTKPVLEL